MGDRVWYRSAKGVFVFAIAMIGCSAERGVPQQGSPEGRSSEKDGGLSSPDQDCTGLSRSQTVSQPCCLAFGVDACGANLFCAAFDGREQPTCYVERSRKDLEACTEDRQCVSGACNSLSGKCRSTPLTKCDPATGCADDPAGRKYGCRVETSPSTCEPIGNGATGDFCVEPTDCASGACKHQKCECVPRCSGKQCGSNGCGGVCGICSASATCSSAGICACTSNLIACGTACVDVRSDSNNCGSCGKSCPATAQCTSDHKCVRAFLYPRGTMDCLQVCLANGYSGCEQLPMVGGCAVGIDTGREVCPCVVDPR